jgi:hypothetical protein
MIISILPRPMRPRGVVCVCVCVRARARSRACMRACVRVSLCLRARARARETERDRERERKGKEQTQEKSGHTHERERKEGWLMRKEGAEQTHATVSRHMTQVTRESRPHGAGGGCAVALPGGLQDDEVSLNHCLQGREGGGREGESERARAHERGGGEAGIERARDRGRGRGKEAGRESVCVCVVSRTGRDERTTWHKRVMLASCWPSTWHNCHTGARQTTYHLPLTTYNLVLPTRFA